MWIIDGKKITSRLILGSALFKSLDELKDCIQLSETQIITVSVRRENFKQDSKNNFLKFLKDKNLYFLPNTAGCMNADEAIETAYMAQEIYSTNWIKLETVGHSYNLQPDPIALLKATEVLIGKGFFVFPYMTDDLWLAEKLVELGCQVLMPWASPIGSGRGILNPYNLKMIRKHFPNLNIIVDAGIGRPSDATQAMELGIDAILLNSAIAKSMDPPKMSLAFKYAVQAGQLSYQAGIMQKRLNAQPSTTSLDRPFWRQQYESSQYETLI